MSEWRHVATPTHVRFGEPAAAALRAALREANVRRVLLVTSPGRADSAAGKAVAGAVGRLLAGAFRDAAAHVPAPTVQAAIRQARAESVDAVVSFGGGSAIDLAKAVSFFLEQEAGTPGASFADRPALAHLSIPTTYSGAEGSPWFAMTDPNARQKGLAGGPTVPPRWVIYDPELFAELTPETVAATGMCALAHALEAVLVGRLSPEAEALAVAAARRVYGSLAAAAGPGADTEARAALLEGAALAARALPNAGLGVAHGLADLVGGRTGIAHGVVCALLLAPCLRFNLDAAGPRADQLAQVLGASDLARAVEELRAELPLPAGLSDCGITDDDLDAVARLSQAHRWVQGNPRPTGEADAKALVEDAF
ncbi:MAG: iron-containing alcohol dehydrogenase family protein [Acidimicrobiales bacterium]